MLKILQKNLLYRKLELRYSLANFKYKNDIKLTEHGR